MLQNWKCRYLHLFTCTCVVRSKQPGSSEVLGAELMCVLAVIFQVRSLMCAWCVVKRSVRAPIWSLTAENTTATSLSAARAALSASRGDWTYSATYRHTRRTTADCTMGPERDQLHASGSSLYWGLIIFYPKVHCVMFVKKMSAPKQTFASVYLTWLHTMHCEIRRHF